MNKSPKKIWVGGTEEAHGDWGTIDVHPDDIPYIRADLVDELVEALTKLSMLYDSMGAPRGPCRILAEAALAKLEESHE